MCVCVYVCLQTTQEQVKTFQAKLEEFNVKFKTEGPTCVGSDLDKGWLTYTAYPLHYVLSELICINA